MNHAAADMYRTQDVLTASPARLVAKLYARAIQSLHEAVRAIEAGDIEGRWRANQRAIEIVDHLLATLDDDRGGEVAENLKRLYLFILCHLAKVDVHNDAKAAHDVIALLQPLHDSWRKLAEGHGDEAAGPDTGAVSETVPTGVSATA